MAKLLLTMSGSGLTSAAETTEVTNNNDSDDGSLRKVTDESSTGDTVTLADDLTGAILPLALGLELAPEEEAWAHGKDSRSPRRYFKGR